MSDLIAEIAAASQEQSTGIGQVNTAITQMDQVVQQNASLVEEATAATESMKEQAGALLQMVSRFGLDEPGGSAEVVAPVDAAPPPAAAPASPRPILVKARTRRSGEDAPAWAAARLASVPKGEWREF